MMTEEKVSGHAAITLGRVCTMLERIESEMAKARVYLGTGKVDSARWCFRAARKEVQKLSRELKHLDVALRQNPWLPQEAPLPPQPTGAAGLKVIK